MRLSLRLLAVAEHHDTGLILQTLYLALCASCEVMNGPKYLQGEAQAEALLPLQRLSAGREIDRRPFIDLKA